jgi:hypothetical protein
MLIEADYMSRRGEQSRIVCAKRYRGMNVAKGSSAFLLAKPGPTEVSVWGQARWKLAPITSACNTVGTS